MSSICTPEEVCAFWFEKCDRKDWFEGAAELDSEIKRQFRDTHLALASGESSVWRETPQNRLAMTVVLDQFPRNIYRGTALAFATDGLALAEAELALQSGDDKRVPEEFRVFFYLPFEHAEDIAQQDRSVALFAELGDPEFLDYARRHREVIASYGRFPHRNRVLGRQSTEAELRYLAQPGAGF
ncbi:DUF924 domain-containing protein (plasmid) [Rhizobium grahamii]|uniref:DUF924 domain-containing protein n=1 Tax=Rhizobium grahamii TaxID=1120045 RepID=A0A5Q0CF28_9HYPH|nr:MULTISPECIES: DUF924 family protein [Rhizobium]QFY63094.1 DUF924 domain-containing protein [Rhizobium grahamii]QRM52142.1 DUF924 domain-containing protein [Rhizobium sp. BG6]